MVGFETGKCSPSSPAVIGRFRSSSSTLRRVGSDNALKTLFMIRYLANHLIKSSPRSMVAHLGVGPMLEQRHPTGGEQDAILGGPTLHYLLRLVAKYTMTGLDAGPLATPDPKRTKQVARESAASEALPRSTRSAGP